MKDADNEQYLKRGTLAVLNVMRDLSRYQTPLMVTFNRGQFISRLLVADEECIIFDLGSNALSNEWVLESPDFSVCAETYGAKIEFTLAALTLVEYEGLPAFSAPLPACAWQIQRREFFRINAPLEPVFWCYTRWPDGSPARFRLQDLSLGGVGVLPEGPLPEGLTRGNKFSQLRVELGEFGQFEVTAELLHIGERSVVRKGEACVIPRLSFRFTAIEPVQERQLQQVIFALERLARDKASRFQ